MMYWNINEASTSSTLPGGASNLNLNDLTDVAISIPQANQVLKYDGSTFINSEVPGLADIQGQINNLGDAVPPYISSITPITPDGTQSIEILGEYFSPSCLLTIPGVVVNSLEIRSPNKIIASINKTGISGNRTITLSNGGSSNQIWAEGIKSVDIVNDPFWSSVVLLLKGDGTNNSTNIIDSSSSARTITKVGDAKISTTQSKYGGSSLLFDGNGDYLTGSLTNFNIRTSPFTIETWLYPLQSVNFSIFGAHPGADFYIQFSSSTWYVGDGSQNNIVVPSQSAPLNQWTHIALSFNGTTYRLFRNGINIGQSSSLLKNFNITAFQIGSRIDQAIYFNGLIDSFRITSTARYINNFNPETDPYLNT